MDRKSLDEIRIEELEVFAHHGVFEEEKQQGQYFYVNVVLYADLRQAGLNDDLTLSTHYGEVSEFIGKYLTEHRWNLIESAAEQTARAILLTFPHVRALDFELRKPHAPIPMKFGSVSVKIHRGWHKAYVAFGSNLGERKSYVEGAIKALSENEQIRVGKVSAFLETKPYGGVEQDDFLNGVLELETLCEPHELLELLHKLEQAAGRERLVHWGPRTLDLDILFFDELVLSDETLTIPHVDLQNRDFVLKPMAEIAPFLRHPLLQKTMRELLGELEGRR